MNLHCQKAWQDEVRDSISVSMCKFNLQALPLAASAPAETPLSAFSNNADEDEVVGAMPLAVQAPSESTIHATSTIADGIESVAETVPSLAITTALSSTAIQVEADEPLPVAVNTALEVGAVGSPPVYVTAPLKPAPTIPSSSVKNESADKLPLAETTSNLVSPPVDTSNGFNSTESVQTGVELISGLNATAIVPSNTDVQGERPVDLVGLDLDGCSCHLDTEMVDVETKLLADEKPASSMETTKRRRSRRGSRKSRSKKQQLPLEKTSESATSLTMEITSSTNCEAVRATSRTPLLTPHHKVEEGLAGTQSLGGTLPTETLVSPPTRGIEVQVLSNQPEVVCAKSQSPTYVPADSAVAVDLTETKQSLTPLETEMEVESVDMVPVAEQAVNYVAEVQSVGPLLQFEAELVEPTSVTAGSVLSQTSVVETPNRVVDVETVEVVAVDTAVEAQVVAAPPVNVTEPPTKTVAQSVSPPGKTGVELHLGFDAAVNVSSTADVKRESSCHVMDAKMVDADSKLLVKERLDTSSETTKLRKIRRGSRKRRSKRQLSLEKTSTPPTSQAVTCDVPLPTTFIEVDTTSAGTEQFIGTARSETSVSLQTSTGTDLEACHIQPEVACVQSVTATPSLPDCAEDVDLAEAKQLSTPLNSELEGESIELAAVVEASSSSQTLVAEPSKEASEKDPAVVLAELAFGVLRTDVEEVAAPPVVTEPLMEAAPRSLSPTIGTSTRLGVPASAETGPELMCDSTASVSANNDDDLELIFAPVAVISKPLLTGPCKNVVVVETVDGKGNIVVEVQEVVAPQVCQTEVPAESAPQTVSPPVGTAELVETGVELVLGKDATLNEPSVANEVEGESATHLVDNYSCNLGSEMVAVETKLPVDKKPASSLHTTKRSRSQRGSRKSGSKKQRLTLKETSTTPAPHTTTSEAACSEAPILTPAAPDSAEDVKLAETKQLSAPSYTEMETEPTTMTVASASCQSSIADSVQVESVVSVHGAPIQSRSSCELPVIKAAPSGCSLPPSTDTEHVLPVITMPESVPGSSLVGETPSSTASDSAIVVGSVVVEIGSLDSLPSEGPVSFVGWKSSDSKVSDEDPLGSRNPSLRKVRPTLESGRSSCKGVSRKWGVLKGQAKPESDTSSTICNTLGTISKPDELECGSSNEQLVPETVISYIPVCPPATSDMSIDIGGGLQFSTAEVLAPLVLTNVEEKKSAKDILKTVVDTQSVERETEKVHVDTSPFQGQKRGSNEVKRGKKRKRSSCNKGIDVDSVAAYVEVTTSPATESVESSKNALVLNHPAKECVLPVGETAPTVPSDTLVTKQAAEVMMECALPLGETAPAVSSNTHVSFQAAKAVLECAFSIGETAPTVPSNTFYMTQAAEAMLECALPVGETTLTVPSDNLHTKQGAEDMLECALPVGETAPTVSSNTRASFQAAKAALERAFSVGEAAPTVPSKTLHMKQAAEAMLECASPVGETAPAVPSDTLVRKQVSGAMLECVLPVSETALPVTNNALGESKETSCGAPEIKQTRKRKRSDLESEDREPQKSSQKEEGCEDSQKVDSETVDEIIKPLEIKTNRQKSKSKRASQKSGRKKLQSVPQRSEGDSVAVASSSTEPLPDQNGTTKSDSSPVLPETEMVCMGGMSQSISSAIVISNEAAEMSALLEAVRARSLSNCMIIPNQIIKLNQSLGLL